LKRELTQSHTLFTAVAAKAKQYLDARFGMTGSDRAYGIPIDISHAVPRCLPSREFTSWWQTESSRSAVAKGEEGMGKSTVTASFVYDLAKTSAALVLWLDSFHWTGLHNIESAVDRGLMLIGFADPKVRERLVRKALKQW